MEEWHHTPAELRFEFHPEDESITCNHRHLTHGAPARLLARILGLFIREGRTYFEFREFKRIRALFPDPKRTNFERSFGRLRSRLENAVPELDFLPEGRGRFRILFRAGRNILLLDPESPEYPKTTARQAEGMPAASEMQVAGNPFAGAG
jgi:hypothetical protein